MPREIKYKAYFDDLMDKELEEIELQCKELEEKAEKLGERLEKIANEIYDARYTCHKDLHSKLNSQAYDLQYKCNWSDWIKKFRIDPHR